MPHLPRPQQPECDGRYGGDTRYGEISGVAAIRRRPEGDAGGRPESRDNANVGRVYPIAGEQVDRMFRKYHKKLGYRKSVGIDSASGTRAQLIYLLFSNF